jgi:hypothetical protein
MNNISNIIVKYNIDFLKSHFKFKNIDEKMQVELLKIFYEEFNNKFREILTNLNNNIELIKEISKIKKTDYKTLVDLIYRLNKEYGIKSYIIYELLLIKQLNKISSKQLDVFYDEFEKKENNNDEIIYSLELFFTKFALNIFIYNVFYNKKFDLKDNIKNMNKIISSYNKNKYEEVGIDFNKSTFNLIVNIQVNDLIKSLSKDK